MKIYILPFVVFLFLSLPGLTQTDQNSSGKLIIIGGGEIPDTIYAIFAAACGGKDQSIVVIPTATGDEEWIKSGGHLKKFTERGFTNLTTIHTRDKVKADDPELIKAMNAANGIFFGGGDQAKLAEAYTGTALHRAMYDLLKRGGVIMGTSAGATIMGSVLIGGDHRRTPNKKQDFPKGLSFMKNTAIDQHVLARNRQFDLLPVLEADTSLFGIAIDESTAAIVEKGMISVAGDSYVLIYDQYDWHKQMREWGRVYMPFRMIAKGATFDLTKRSIINK
jgi:cyanophycinase